MNSLLAKSIQSILWVCSCFFCKFQCLISYSYLHPTFINFSLKKTNFSIYAYDSPDFLNLFIINTIKRQIIFFSIFFSATCPMLNLRQYYSVHAPNSIVFRSGDETKLNAELGYFKLVYFAVTLQLA